MAFVSSFWSNACPTSSLPDTRSESSSKTTGNSPPPRLSALLCLYRLNDKFRTIFPRNVDRMLGLCGGMEFHAFKYVSFTHSSASSLLPNMFWQSRCNSFHTCLLLRGLPAHSYPSITGLYLRHPSAFTPLSNLPFHLYTQLLNSNLTHFFKYLSIP